MANIKILVNFKTKKISHTTEHRGSKIYGELVKRGYEEVGVIKESMSPVSIFVEDGYFEPKDKYIPKIIN